MHQYDEFIEEMLRTRWEQCDARAWFAASPRHLFEFDRLETDRILDSIYARGADDVRVVGEPEEIENGRSVDMLLIVLPTLADRRQQLFEVSEQVAGETGLDADVDEGQKYMLLRWT
jgi:hypothetical protein